MRVGSPQEPSYLFRPRGALVEWLSTLGKFAWKVGHCGLCCKNSGGVTRRLHQSTVREPPDKEGKHPVFPGRSALPDQVRSSFSASVKQRWMELGGRVVKYDKRERNDKPHAVCSPAARSPGHLPELKPLSIVPPP